jgi:voltage-gated potassium channel
MTLSPGSKVTVAVMKIDSTNSRGYARTRGSQSGGRARMTVGASGGARARFLSFVDRHEMAWELTMAALAVAFVVVGFLSDEPGSSGAYGSIEIALTALFVAEFGARFLASYDRTRYLRGHWIDLVALVPVARGLRLARLLRLLRLVRAFAGVFRVVARLERMAAHRGLAWLVVAWLGVMVICSIGLYIAENGVNAAVETPLDALWWGIVTLTTVGYGDVVPKTPEGKIAASLLMLLGIGLFSAITATMASYLISTGSTPGSPIRAISELGELRANGLITDAEFESKKADLLSRI